MADNGRSHDKEPKSRTVWELVSLGVLGVMLLGTGILIGYALAALVAGALGIGN
jgi:hypothetical protein